MPHKQKHRGPRPNDEKLFNKQTQWILKEAVKDYDFLLTRGYSEDAIFKLVGDRYQLRKRQRYAVMRCACGDQSLAHRNKTRLETTEGISQPVLIDGFNLIITIESALSGGFIFEGRDGCFRDLSSIHASYKRVEETWPSLALIGKYLENHTNQRIIWYLDEPVSNSGRLKQYLLELAGEKGWNWEVELKKSPDFALKQRENPIVSTDGFVLDQCQSWLNLGRWIIENCIPQSRIFSLKP